MSNTNPSQSAAHAPFVSDLELKYGKVEKKVIGDFEPDEIHGIIIGNGDYTNWGNHPEDPKKPDAPEKPIFNQIDNAHGDMDLAK